MSQRERWTAEKIAALPEGPEIAVRIVTSPDGAIWKFPIMPDTEAVWLEDYDVKNYVDKDGVRWTLGRYADGHYFKQRRS